MEPINPKLRKEGGTYPCLSKWEEREGLKGL
jgi:hypothetical protein